MVIVPPGGFAGFSQMTAASKVALGGRGAARGSGKRRRRKATKQARASRKRTKSAKGGRRMKFGSPAWQKKYKVGRHAKKRRG